MALPTDSQMQPQQVQSAGSIVVDQSILDQSSQMLEFLKKENAKVKDENAKLHRDVSPCPTLSCFREPTNACLLDSPVSIFVDREATAGSGPLEAVCRHR